MDLISSSTHYLVFYFISWLISLVLLYALIFGFKLPEVISDQLYNYATSVAVFSMIGSLIYSEVVGFIPCKFCWYQRYIMYPLAIFLLLDCLILIYEVRYLVCWFLYWNLSYISSNGGGSGGSCAIDVPCNLKY